MKESGENSPDFFDEIIPKFSPTTYRKITGRPCIWLAEDSHFNYNSITRLDH